MSDNRITSPGVYADLPMEAYIADPCPTPSLSTSIAQALTTLSPAHAFDIHPRLGGRRDDSSRADLGSAAHAALLGGMERVVYVDAPDWRTKDARDRRDAARAAGKIPVLAHMARNIEAMTASAQALLDHNNLNLARRENTLLWQQDGIWCRSRPDMMQDDYDVAADYKTSTCADPALWCRTTLFRGGYDLQAALALAGLDILCGQRLRQFMFLVQEIDPPHCCSLIALGPAALDAAVRKVDAAAKAWAHYLALGEFPGYSRQIHYAELPAFADLDWAQRESIIMEALS